MNLQDKLKQLPSSPGVYLMKDSLGHIIYAGKSKHLKNRVSSYFHSSKGHSPKVKRMVQHIRDFELILMDTEFEALMLECRLIKEYKPMYNRKLKNPLNYPFIEIRMEKDLPSIGISYGQEKDGGHLYFGPYPSRGMAERALQGLKECFRIVCSNPSSKRGPCLNVSMGLCIGICLGGEAAKEYRRIVAGVIGLLEGADMGLLTEMQREMAAAAERYDFEAAAKLRDQVEAVQSLLHKEKVIEFTEKGQNAVIVEDLGENAAKIFWVKRNRILHSVRMENGVLSAPYGLKTAETVEAAGVVESAEAAGTTKVAEAAEAARAGPSCDSGDGCIKELRRLAVECFGGNGDAAERRKELTREEMDEALIIHSYITGGSCRSILIPEEWLEPGNLRKLDDALQQLLTKR